MTYFTVTTKSYLPYARVLMGRLKALDPAAERYVFLADRVEGFFNPDTEPFRVVEIHEFIEPELLPKLAFQYSAFELCNALKAFAHLHLNRTTNHELWVYFDSDIYPLLPPDAMLKERGDGSVYLTPHMLKACPINLARPLETNLLRYGTYNGGWLGIRRSPNADAFIDWFILRLSAYCFDGHGDTYVDQLWLNLAPLLFDGVHVVRHPGANIGYWNLHERPLRKNASGVLESDGEEALFFHFSGWDVDKPEVVSRNLPGVSAHPLWHDVAETYRSALLSAGLMECRAWPYSWENYNDGRQIRLAERRRYAEERLVNKEADAYDPFENADRLIEKRPTMSQAVRQQIARLPYLKELKRTLSSASVSSSNG